MFEREIQRAKELLMQRMTAASQYVYWDEIRRRADIPVFYRNFFGAEAQWWIFDHQMQRSVNPRFDYTNDDIVRLLGELDQHLMESARFDHQDLNTTLDLAVKTRFNYILRPRTTLKWFVYRGEPTKTLSEILLRIDYFLEYDYLLDGVRKWLADKQHERYADKNFDKNFDKGFDRGFDKAFDKFSEQKPTEYAGKPESLRPDAVRTFSPNTGLISVVEFDRVLQNVDNDVILDYSPEEFTDLLTPLFEMFDEIHAADRALQQYRGKVPTPALIIFLDDKGIYRIAQELEELMKTRSLRYLGQREFMHVLNGIVAKLELAIDNNTLPKPLPLEDTTTLPLAFAAQEEPILKADDTIGELAIGTAIRTKRPITEEKPPQVPNEQAPNEQVPNEQAPSNQAPSNQAPNEQDFTEPRVIDAEFEITEPVIDTRVQEEVQGDDEKIFDQTAFSAQAANIAEMVSMLTRDEPSNQHSSKHSEPSIHAPLQANTSNESIADSLSTPRHNEPQNQAQSVESSIGQGLQERAEQAETNTDTPESKHNFFTRWGSIFGTPRTTE
jgi:hypothetical protein